MATLEKLGILGIRSFSPDTLEVLSFERPFTLIVGHNGAGKTTIVECLKMATTGELPPTAGKGHYFIHQSKDLVDVKGQIRLVFRSATGVKVLANRNFQLLNTKDRKGNLKSSYKALESVLQVRDAEGNTRSINNKCTAMDAQVPQFLGVSKAVLENVIFCHQEDSTWPLGEMTKLKKRFDDLFGATRYSRALEEIEKLRKENQRIGKEKFHCLELVKQDLEHAKQIKNKVASAKEKDQSLSDELSQLNAELPSLQTELDAASALFDKIGSSGYELKALKLQIHNLTKQQDDLASSIEQQFTDPLEDILEFRNSIRSEQAKHKKNVTEVQEIISDLEIKLDKTTRAATAAQDSSFESIRVKERLVGLKQRKDEIWLKVRTEFPLLHHEEPELRNFIETTRAKLSKLNVDSSAINTKIRLTQEDFKRLSNQEMMCHTRISFCTDEIERLSKLVEKENSLEADSKKLEFEINENLDLVNDIKCRSQTLESELSNLSRARQEFQTRLEKITSTIHQVEEANFEEQKLAMLKNQLDIVNSQISINLDLIVPHYPHINRSSLDRWSEVNLEKLRQCKDLTIKEEGTKLSKEIEVGNIKGQAAMLQQQMENVKLEYELVKDVLDEADVNIENFESTLNALKNEDCSKTKELLITQNAEKLYSNYLNHSIQKNKCSFCTRPFKDKSEADLLVKNLNSRISKLPETIIEAKRVAQDTKVKLEKYERLQPAIGSIKTLAKDQADKENSLNLVKQKLDLSVQELDLATGSMADAQEALHRTQEVKNLFATVKALENDWIDISQQVETLEHSIASVKPKKSGSLEDNKSMIRQINIDLRNVDLNAKEHEDELRKLRQSLAAKQEEISHTRTLQHHLSTQMASFVEMRKECSVKVEEKTSLQRQEEDLKIKLNSVAVELSALQQERDSVENHVRVSREKLTGDLKSLDSICDELREVELKIESSNELQTVSDDAERKLEELKIESSQLIENLETKRQEGRELLEAISNSSALLDKVEANIKLHSLSEEIEKCEEKKEEIVRLCKGEDPNQLKQAIEELNGKIQKISNRVAVKSGEKNATLEWCKDHLRELNSTKFKDVDERYRDATVEVETQLMIVRDLQRYHSAMDKALMRYHSNKMSEINRALKHLWRIVYCGTDIDYIAIRSDVDEESGGVAAHKQRSYNYRVTMVKEGAELDMRGRCSAGQKVVASIVIRLALAESFCVSCGILTLDEPTTNLDRANMEGLAKALAHLIESRRHCANFQLILITHDEEFVRLIARHQPCDSFVQVEKNALGYSTIQRSDIRLF